MEQQNDVGLSAGGRSVLATARKPWLVLLLFYCWSLHVIRTTLASSNDVPLRQQFAFRPSDKIKKKSEKVSNFRPNAIRHFFLIKIIGKWSKMSFDTFFDLLPFDQTTLLEHFQ